MLKYGCRGNNPGAQSCQGCPNIFTGHPRFRNAVSTVMQRLSRLQRGDRRIMIGTLHRLGRQAANGTFPPSRGPNPLR